MSVILMIADLNSIQSSKSPDDDQSSSESSSRYHLVLSHSSMELL